MRRSARHANSRSRSHHKRKRHNSDSGSSSSQSSRRVRKRSYEAEEPDHAVVAETKAVSFTEEEEEPEVSEDEPVEPQNTPQDVQSYALASLEIKRMNSVWSDFRKAKTQIKNEAQNVLLGTMLERGCRTRKLRDVDGTDYVVRLTTRYQVGKLTDDAIHSALISTFGTEDVDENNSEDADEDERELNQDLEIPESVDDAIEKLYKGVQRARTTRKTVVQCAEATESLDAEDIDEDLQEVATSFVKAEKSLRNTREEVKNRIKPYQEAMDRAENSIRDMLREKKSTTFKLDFEDGEGVRNINVSRRDNKRAKKPAAKKLTAQVIKDALRLAVVESCGSTVRCGNMLAAIRTAIQEATKPEDVPTEEPTVTSSLVVRVCKSKENK